MPAIHAAVSTREHEACAPGEVVFIVVPQSAGLQSSACTSLGVVKPTGSDNLAEGAKFFPPFGITDLIRDKFADVF